MLHPDIRLHIDTDIQPGRRQHRHQSAVNHVRPLGQRDDPLSLFLGRRLDDLAYGAGLWAGALRHRSLLSLRVRAAGRSARRWHR
jgi:hypothetical protein